MALLGYPDHLLDEQGNPKPGVTGPSPASMGLLSAGLGMLSTPTYSRLPGDMSGIGQGAMQGLQAYQERLNQIQQQRKDYNQSLMQAQNQEMAKQRFGLEMGEAKRLEDRRKQMVSELPNLLEQMRSLPIPGIEQQIASIQAMANAGAPEKAYQAAVTIMGQKIPTKTNVQHKMIPGTNSGYLVDETSGQFLGQFTTGETKKYGTSLHGKDALAFLKKQNPDFQLDGIESNLVVETHPDGTYKSHKYVTGKKGALNSAQTSLLDSYSKRFEAHPLLKQADQVIEKYQYLDNLGKSNPDGKMGVQDVAMIFGFMKALDPNSVVRETEYATAANAGIGVPEIIWRNFNRAKDGDILLPSVRKKMIETAKLAVESRIPQFKTLRNSWLKRSDTLGLDQETLGLFLRNPFDALDAVSQETTPPPKVTEVPEPGPVEDDNAAELWPKWQASLDLGPKEPEKPKRGIEKFQKSGKVSKVSVLPGDGISQILRAAGLKYTQPNIDEIIGYRLNKGRFNSDGTLKKSGGVIYIPKSIYRK